MEKITDFHFDLVHNIEQKTSLARSQISEAILNLLQSRTDHSHSGPMLSAATRATLGKRGIAQLEAVKEALGEAVESARLALRDAGALREEIRSSLTSRDEAVERAAEAQKALAMRSAQTEEDAAARLVALNEAVRRAEQASVAAIQRAEVAEARAEVADAAHAESEKARRETSEAILCAERASREAKDKVERLEAQLRREREVLAKLMAENVLFVKRLQLSEGERERAEREKHELLTQWRGQTEAWFRSATEEMQSQLIGDWGAAELVRSELRAVETAVRLAAGMSVEYGFPAGMAFFE